MTFSLLYLTVFPFSKTEFRQPCYDLQHGVNSPKKFKTSSMKTIKKSNALLCRLLGKHAFVVVGGFMAVLAGFCPIAKGSTVPELIDLLNHSNGAVERSAIIELDGLASENQQAKKALSRHIGEKFFALLDLNGSELVSIRTLVAQKKWAEALDAYRDLFLEKMSNHEPENCRFWAFGSTRGEELLANGIVRGTPDGTPLMAVKIGLPGKVNWWPDLSSWEPGKSDKSAAKIVLAPPTTFANHLPRFYWANKLVQEYARTGNSACVTAFLGYYWDFFLQHGDQLKAVLALPPELREHYSAPKQSTAPLFTADRMECFLIGMQSLCATQGPLLFNGQPETTISPRDLNAVKSAIDSGRLAVVLMGVHDTLGVMEKIKARAPNQVENALFARFKWSKVFEDFRGSAELLANAEKDLDVLLHHSTFLPDGTSMEQAQYNIGFPPFYTQMKNRYPQAPWLPDLEKAARLRERYVFSLLRWQIDPSHKDRSIAMWPLLSNQTDREWTTKPLPDLNDPVVAAIDQAMKGEGKGPAFTSIYLPYGGYVVSRGGWAKDDAYLFMKNAGAPIGHSDPAFNGVQIGAFGETMIIRSYEWRSYNAGTPEEFYATNSFSASTVAAVDGLLSQAPDLPGPACEKTLPHRWYTSDHFDFSEGLVNRWAPAGTTDAQFKPQAYKTGVEHQREVIFLRKLGTFIITDRMKAGDAKQHAYTQTWNFNGTFGKDDVSAEEAGQRIVTVRKKGPNIALQQFSAQPLTYEKYYGFRDETAKVAYGWKGQDVPKPDVHAKWKAVGDNLVVTLVRPFAGDADNELKQINSLTSNGLTGFHAKPGDGTVVEYLARNDTGEIKLSGMMITGRGILRVSSPDGTVRGLAIDCESINGEPSPMRNFEFVIENGKMNPVAEIKMPETFRWEETVHGIVPVYSSRVGL